MNKKSKILFNGAEIATSFIYICAICSVLMYVLCRDQALLCAVIMTAVTFAIFMIFFKLRLRRLFSLLAFVGLFIVIDVICSAMTTGRSPSFMQFIFSGSEIFDPFCAAAAILMFSMIIGFTVAYFTAYLPRPCFLLLPAFIPLILGARTITRLPAGLIIFMAVGCLAAMLGISRPEKADENYTDDKNARRERLIAMGILISSAAVIFMILPRAESTRYSTFLNTVLRQQRNEHFGAPSLGELTSTARPNTGNNAPATNTLFYAATLSPALVSSGSYDVYKGEEGWAWTEDKDTLMGYPKWQTEQKNINYNSLIGKLKAAAASGKLAEHKDEISRLPGYSGGAGSMMIYVIDGSNTSVILHPQRTFNVKLSRADIETYRNSKDEIFTEDPFGRYAAYNLEFYPITSDTPLLSALGSADLRRLLDAAYDENVITSAEYNAFLYEEEGAHQYQQIVGTEGISPRIQTLADEITAGLSTDLEKALAIEKWFGDAGFYYDLSFTPEEPTADYFLFDSKRGICTDFATASTLLLRAAGIPARYTEGYVLSEDSKDNYGRYAVTAAQAHAYATAYISGYGWLEVDGTRYAPVSSLEDTVRNVTIVLVITAAVVAVLAILFRRQLSELFFAVSLRFRKKNDQVRAVYLRTRKLACSVTGADPNTTTAEEVRDIISRTLFIDKEAAEITAAANELMYGSSPETETAADCGRLYRDYRAIYKMKRSMKK